MRRYALLAAGASALLTLTACRGVTLTAAGPPAGAVPTAGAAPAAPAAPAAAPGTLTALAEPDNGVGAIYRLIGSARRSVELTMYELRDPTAEHDLAAAAARGADVRVILDRHLEKDRNTAAYDYLTAHHVHVRWAPAGITYHQKTLTVDGTISVIMSLNLVTADYASTRDFAVIDSGRDDIGAIVATFDDDYAGHKTTPPDGTDLVWSPTNSQSSILAVIDSARHTLSVENEEMSSRRVVSALASAARRGVDVKVVMTADSEWDRPLSRLTAAGAHVRLYPDSEHALYIHAKAVVADAGRRGAQVFVGSENFSTASLDRSRELGIRTADKAVIATINEKIESDYRGAAAGMGHL